jgi:AbrB family looped-hinge helix DNA binding protein
MLEYRAQIKKGGRIIIPAPIRKKLHFEIGDEVLLKVAEEELHVSTLDRAINQAQEIVKKYNPSHKKLTDELFTLRKEDSKYE